MQNLQNKPAKPNLPNQTYWIKPTKPNLPNQTYQTKPTKPKQTYVTKRTKMNLPNHAKPATPNLPSQTCRYKHANQTSQNQTWSFHNISFPKKWHRNPTPRYLGGPMCAPPQVFRNAQTGHANRVDNRYSMIQNFNRIYGFWHSKSLRWYLHLWSCLMQNYHF